MAIGVNVDDHVVYGDCRARIHEHWSWDHGGWDKTLDHSWSDIGQVFPNDKLTSFQILPGHGWCTVDLYEHGDYKGKKTRIHTGWVPNEGWSKRKNITDRPYSTADNTTSSIHIDNGMRYRFDSAGSTISNWSKDPNKLATQACGKSMYEQALFGVSNCQQKNRPTFARVPGSALYRPGDTRSTAFCARVENMPVVVDANTGETCYDKLSSAALKKSKGIAFCKKKPTSELCKCINVARSDFLSYCRKNPTLPGCKELLVGVKEFEDAGLTSASGLFGNPDCIVPSICAGNVYEPLTGMPACANKTAICNQLLQLDNIKAAAGIKAAQACNIDFEAEQRKKNKAKKNKNLRVVKGSQSSGSSSSGSSGSSSSGSSGSSSSGSSGSGSGSSSDSGSSSLRDQFIENKGILGAGAGAVSSSSCCCLVLVLVILSM